MSHKIAPLVDIVRHEDKEAKLRSFIRLVVEQAGARSDGDATKSVVLLVARSVESPVAKAVAALVREGSIPGPVTAILALAPRESADGSADDSLLALIGDDGARVVRDIRLFDAHEQLVLGASSSWIGDCMRRDPMKRDAYECFAADCAKTAGWARMSFNRLWDTCEPLLDEPRAVVVADAVAGAYADAVADDSVADPARSTSS